MIYLAPSTDSANRQLTSLIPPGKRKKCRHTLFTDRASWSNYDYKLFQDVILPNKTIGGGRQHHGIYRFTEAAYTETKASPPELQTPLMDFRPLTIRAETDSV